MASVTIMLALFLLAVLVLTVVVIVTSNNHKKRIEEITLYQINTSAIIDESIPQILDLIIQESFNDYQIKSLISLGEEHINSNKEAEIRKELTRIVTGRISNAALDKLSLFYNIANIADIMADKIYIMVMNFVIDHNSNISDSK